MNILPSLIVFLLCFIVFLTFYQKQQKELSDLKQQTTQEKQSREKTEAANEELLHTVQETKDTQSSHAAFYYTMTHNMQTSIQNILRMTAVAKKNEQNPGRLIDCHEKIESSALYLESLLTNVSELSRIESGEFLPAEESFDLKLLMKKCVTKVHKAAEEEGIHITLEQFIDFAPPRVLGYPSYIERIFSTLLENAVQYNKARGHISVHAELLSQSEDTILCQIAVKDTGIGIEEAFLPHIFELFTQENARLFAAWHSSGLSLAITRQILSELNGTIDVQSEAGKGSTFTVTLPLKVDRFYVSEEAGSDLSSIRVLLADGNALNCEMIGHHLRSAGVTVEVAEDGRIAVNKAERAREDYYQFLLIDTDIPIMNCMETVQCIREFEHMKNLCIIGMAKANTLTQDIDAYLNSGMNFVLKKPLDMEKVLYLLKSN